MLLSCRPLASRVGAFRMHGKPFEIVSVTAPQTIRPEVLAYWTSARFVDHLSSLADDGSLPGRSVLVRLMNGATAGVSPIATDIRALGCVRSPSLGGPLSDP
jgi:hypothetical protein